MAAIQAAAARRLRGPQHRSCAFARSPPCRGTGGRGGREKGGRQPEAYKTPFEKRWDYMHDASQMDLTCDVIGGGAADST